MLQGRRNRKRHRRRSPCRRRRKVADTIVGTGPGGISQNDLGAAQPAAADKEDKPKDGKRADAVAHVKPAAGAPKDMQVSGTVRFMKAEHGLKVMVDLKGLKPNAKHGFHIHEKGDLSAPDLKSAGPHFNPGGKKHGGPEGDERHGGDLGNLTADDKGNVKTEIMAHGVTIDGEKDGIIGRSVIVHAKADDLKTDPAGDSGDRIAGVRSKSPTAIKINQLLPRHPLQQKLNPLRPRRRRARNQRV